MKSDKQHQGDLIENQARDFLIAQKLKPIASNFHSRFGEIDLIMLDQSTLVFVEVRFRHNQNHGDALASISKNKQTKIIKTAQFFLMRHPSWQNHAYRFDAVAKTGNHMLWLKNAFCGD